MNVENNQGVQRFEVVSGGATAFLAYDISDDAIALTHTKVPESLSGSGIAGELERRRRLTSRDHNTCKSSSSVRSSHSGSSAIPSNTTSFGG